MSIPEPAAAPPFGVSVEVLLEAPSGVAVQSDYETNDVRRTSWAISGSASCLKDDFRHADNASCSFLRLMHGSAGALRFSLNGLYGLSTCASGGWLLGPADASQPTYWIPRQPTLRRYDAKGRVLSETAAPLLAAVPATAASFFEVGMHAGAALEIAVWRLPPSAAGLVHELESLLVIEQQSLFMLSSHTSYTRPADAYLFLLHGHVYENRFDFKTKRKICSELEAYSLYLALLGLEAATGKKLYRLLRKQVVGSVLARQETDGSWRHGEWSDFMETHLRFQSAALLMLEAELEQATDEAVRGALERGARFLAGRADRTDIGLWFLHDSLEESEEQLTRSGARWIASTELGKAPATKMILNTHLDTTVCLDRYREVTGDGQYAERVSSAVAATRALLGLRPAEPLYRALYWAIGLTLLPAEQARQLSLPMRALRRITRRFVVRRLHYVKRRFPRMVMPGGLIERHLSRLHFGVNYHSVNIADLARLMRRFAEEPHEGILENAVAAVARTSLLQYWIEAKQRQSLGYWVEALYHLCTLQDDDSLRGHLAQAVISATDVGLGLPPAVLGAHPEVCTAGQNTPCPSPSDARLRVVNLSRRGCREILVVNPAAQDVDLAWQSGEPHGLWWQSSSGDEEGGARVPARGWCWARERAQA